MSVTEALDNWMKTGAGLIATERDRQRLEENFTPEHDDGHFRGELVKAANGYLVWYLCVCQNTLAHPQPVGQFPPLPPGWPWGPEDWKPSNFALRNLVKAGALIAAEIDRLQRASEANGPSSLESGAKESVAKCNTPPPP